MIDAKALPVFPGVPLWSMNVGLDGTQYTLLFDWHAREGRWFLTVSIPGLSIATGVKIIADFPLLRRAASRYAPKGVLVAADTSGRGIPPTLDDFGLRVRLTYVGEVTL